MPSSQQTDPRFYSRPEPISDNSLPLLQWKRAIEFVKLRHHVWSQHLLEWSERAHPELNLSAPKCEVWFTAPRKAGMYRTKSKTCVYYLPYAMLEAGFDSTIAHECCHHFQYLIYPSGKWHGDFFYYLLQRVCGYNRGRCHNYDVGKAKQLAQFLKGLKS